MAGGVFDSCERREAEEEETEGEIITAPHIGAITPAFGCGGGIKGTHMKIIGWAALIISVGYCVITERYVYAGAIISGVAVGAVMGMYRNR